MDNTIINRVAKSDLVVIDLEDYYPIGKRQHLDISNWLLEGLVLREKEFRTAVDNHDWSQYKGSCVSLSCSTDAIIPGWAYMLLSIKLSPHAEKIIVGTTADVIALLYQEIIHDMDIEPYKGKNIIIKGCSNKQIPQSAYVLLTSKLQPIANKIMYGEACSSVPLFKKE